MDLLLAALPFLVLLACPLAMVFCMRGMRGRGSKASQPTQMEAAPQTREARIAALEGRLEEIRGELTTLQAPARPTADLAHRSDRVRSDADAEVGPVTPRPA